MGVPSPRQRAKDGQRLRLRVLQLRGAALGRRAAEQRARRSVCTQSSCGHDTWHWTAIHTQVSSADRLSFSPAEQVHLRRRVGAQGAHAQRLRRGGRKLELELGARLLACGDQGGDTCQSVGGCGRDTWQSHKDKDQTRMARGFSPSAAAAGSAACCGGQSDTCQSKERCECDTWLWTAVHAAAASRSALPAPAPAACLRSRRARPRPSVGSTRNTRRRCAAGTASAKRRLLDQHTAAEDGLLREFTQSGRDPYESFTCVCAG